SAPACPPALLTLPRMWLHLLCKPSVIMAAPGHFFGIFLLVQEGVSTPSPSPGPVITKARRHRRASLCSEERGSAYAASSSTTTSSSSPSPSAGLGPRRGPLASA